MKLPCLLITDALAFHTLREYSNREQFGQRGAPIPLPSPVPKSEGPGAPSVGFGIVIETGATRLGTSHFTGLDSDI